MNYAMLKPELFSETSWSHGDSRIDMKCGVVYEILSTNGDNVVIDNHGMFAHFLEDEVDIITKETHPEEFL